MKRRFEVIHYQDITATSRLWQFQPHITPPAHRQESAPAPVITNQPEVKAVEPMTFDDLLPIAAGEETIGVLPQHRWEWQLANLHRAVTHQMKKIQRSIRRLRRRRLLEVIPVVLIVSYLAFRCYEFILSLHS